jgi:DUF971 family protein
MTEAKIWPTEIRLSKDKGVLTVTFNNGESFAYTAEYLRVESPSAEVQGHGQGQRQWLGGKRNVEIMKIEQVGNYAVRLTFTDLHNTGIFSWDYLLKLGRERDEIWQAYLDAIAERGIDRGKPGRHEASQH